MNELEPFSRYYIEEHLFRCDIKFVVDDEGRYLAMYGPTAARPVDLHVYYSAEGHAEEVFAIRATTPRYYPAAETTDLLTLINRWHAEMRWPKVSLQHSPAEPTLVCLVAESHLDLTCGQHPAGLDHFSLTSAALADRFFSWLEAEYSERESDITEIEGWLRDAG